MTVSVTAATRKKSGVFIVWPSVCVFPLLSIEQVNHTDYSQFLQGEQKIVGNAIVNLVAVLTRQKGIFDCGKANIKAP
jgi:hypothetical protein